MRRSPDPSPLRRASSRFVVVLESLIAVFEMFVFFPCVFVVGVAFPFYEVLEFCHVFFHDIVFFQQLILHDKRRKVRLVLAVVRDKKGLLYMFERLT